MSFLLLSRTVSTPSFIDLSFGAEIHSGCDEPLSFDIGLLIDGWKKILREA
jgi:hypothetical protein